MSQRSFASAEYALKKKRTRREQFLEEMERIVPLRLSNAVEDLAPDACWLRQNALATMCSLTMAACTRSCAARA